MLDIFWCVGWWKQKPIFRKLLKYMAFLGVSGGERGIRTLDTGLPYTHFPGVRLQPLGHLSEGAHDTLKCRCKANAQVSAQLPFLVGSVPAGK